MAVVKATHVATRHAPVRKPLRAGRLRFAPRALGLVQAVRLAGCAVAIAAERAAGAASDVLRAPEEREARRLARRERAAERVAATLGALKGVFVKAGQFGAVRYDVVPGAVREALASLRDRVPPLRPSRIRAAVESELGAPLETLFAEFERAPLGAASIAQVHRARLPSGEPVAVKVQYPWLAASLGIDVAIARKLLALWTRSAGAPPVDGRRVFDEFAAGLAAELDFEHEARVAAEIAANLAADAQVVVPRIFASHSTSRVLTMSYLPAVSVDDAAGLARLGVAPRAVVEILARAYAKQIFVDGLFHADPHPGNLFVLDEPAARERPRLLFVDFGLSRRLDPVLRRELRQGLYALMQRDLDAFLGGMERMHMIAPGAHAGVRASVASMFERIGAAGGALGVGGAQVLSLKDTAVLLLQETPGLQLPNDLLLYAKTLSYLFALGQRLDPDVDLMQLSLPYLVRFLAERD